MKKPVFWKFHLVSFSPFGVFRDSELHCYLNQRTTEVVRFRLEALWCQRTVGHREHDVAATLLFSNEKSPCSIFFSECSTVTFNRRVMRCWKTSLRPSWRRLRAVGQLRFFTLGWPTARPPGRASSLRRTWLVTAAEGSSLGCVGPQRFCERSSRARNAPDVAGASIMSGRRSNTGRPRGRQSGCSSGLYIDGTPPDDGVGLQSYRRTRGGRRSVSGIRRTLTHTMDFCWQSNKNVLEVDLQIQLQLIFLSRHDFLVRVNNAWREETQAEFSSCKRFPTVACWNASHWILQPPSWS